MRIIKFNYFPRVFVNPKTEKVEYLHTPLIDIRLCYKHRLNKNLVRCLLDSGADRNLFPAEWGESIGINIKKGEKITHFGIGQGNVVAYRHKVKMYVGVYHFETSADFSYQQSIPLLGREDFFKYFKQITFLEKEKVVELKY